MIKGVSQAFQDHDAHLISGDGALPPTRHFSNTVGTPDQNDQVSQRHSKDELTKLSILQERVGGGTKGVAVAGDVMIVESRHNTKDQEGEDLKAYDDKQYNVRSICRGVAICGGCAGDSATDGLNQYGDSVAGYENPGVELGTDDGALERDGEHGMSEV